MSEELENKEAGVMFRSRPTSKTDWNGRIEIEGKSYVLFGYQRSGEKNGKKWEVIGLNYIVDDSAPQTAPATAPPQGDLPF